MCQQVVNAPLVFHLHYKKITETTVFVSRLLVLDALSNTDDRNVVLDEWRLTQAQGTGLGP